MSKTDILPVLKPAHMYRPTPASELILYWLTFMTPRQA